MLSIVNFILIIIIAVVISVNCYYMVKTRGDIRTINDTLKNKNPSILDLAEFNGLDPTFKDKYRKHIVNELMPEYMGAANQLIKAYKVNEAIEKKGDEISKTLMQLGQQTKATSTVMAAKA